MPRGTARHRVGTERGNAAGGGERGAGAAPRRSRGEDRQEQHGNPVAADLAVVLAPRVSERTDPHRHAGGEGSEPRLRQLPAGERDLGSAPLSPWVSPPSQTQVVSGRGGMAGSRGHGQPGGPAACTAPGRAARRPRGHSAATRLPELVGSGPRQPHGPGHARTTT